MFEVCSRIFAHEELCFQETYQKVKSNLPTRLKRKAERQRLEREDSKRMRDGDDPNNLENNFVDNNNRMMSLNDEQPKDPSPMNDVGGNSLATAGDGKSHVNENGLADGSHRPATANGGDPSSLPGLSKPAVERKPGGPKVLLTGFIPSELSEAKKMCEELGLEVTSQPRMATHLVMPCLNRTISFLCAISFVKFVLSVDWIKDSHKELKLKGKFKVLSFFKRSSGGFACSCSFAIRVKLS